MKHVRQGAVWASVVAVSLLAGVFIARVWQRVYEEVEEAALGRRASALVAEFAESSVTPRGNRPASVILGDIRDLGPLAIHKLRTLLDHEDFGVRSNAIAGLVLVGDKDAPALVAHKLLHDEHPEVQYAAIRALGQCGTRESIQVLATVVGSPEFSGIVDRGPPVRGVACSLLVYVPIRAFAAEELGLLRAEGAVAELCIAADDKNAYIKSKAMEALGRIGTEEAMSKLISLLEDDDEQARWNAAYSLGLIHRDKAVEALLRALSRENQGAIAGLGRCGDPRAFGPLMRALGHSDPRARYSACRALAELGNPEALEALRGMARDESEYVREAAQMAIWELGGGAGRLSQDVRDSEPSGPP